MPPCVARSKTARARQLGSRVVGVITIDAAFNGMGRDPKSFPSGGCFDRFKVDAVDGSGPNQRLDLSSEFRI